MRTYTDLSQALKEQDKVQILDLSNQGLTEIPVEIFQLTNLTQLNLGSNKELNWADAFNKPFVYTFQDPDRIAPIGFQK